MLEDKDTPTPLENVKNGLVSPSHNFNKKIKKGRKYGIIDT